MSFPFVLGRRISKSYGSGVAQVSAVREADIEVRRGEILLLTGPSGSGKTTLLSMMGGILRPTSGILRVAGQEIGSLDESALAELRRQQVGFVFQGYNLFPSLRAWQNVGVALHVKGTPRRRIRPLSVELLSSVGLAEKVNAFPSDLSGGQKQRVAIARALAGNPGLILADEPTAALDSENGRAVISLLRRLATEGNRAVVIVTHDLRVQEFADRVTRIEDGRIIETIETGSHLLPDAWKAGERRYAARRLTFVR